MYFFVCPFVNITFDDGTLYTNGRSIFSKYQACKAFVPCSSPASVPTIQSEHTMKIDSKEHTVVRWVQTILVRMLSKANVVDASDLGRYIHEPVTPVV